MVTGHNAQFGATSRGYASPVDAALEKDYAFELAASNIRFGEGVTKEVGLDFKVGRIHTKELSLTHAVS